MERDILAAGERRFTPKKSGMNWPTMITTHDFHRPLVPALTAWVDASQISE